MRRRVATRATFVFLIAVLGLGVIPFATGPARAQELDEPLRFDAQAVNLSNIQGRGTPTARLSIVINRWSTNEERNALLAALKEGGRRSLPDALVSQDRVGTIREIRSRAEFLRYSRKFDLPDGGQRIILAADRPMGFIEMTRGLRTQDYNVSLVQLDLNAEGEGEGTIFLGAQIAWNEENQQVVVEGFATEPIRLTRVRER